MNIDHEMKVETEGGNIPTGDDNDSSDAPRNVDDDQTNIVDNNNVNRKDNDNNNEVNNDDEVNTASETKVDEGVSDTPADVGDDDNKPETPVVTTTPKRGRRPKKPAVEKTRKKRKRVNEDEDEDYVEGPSKPLRSSRYKPRHSLNTRSAKNGNASPTSSPRSPRRTKTRSSALQNSNAASSPSSSSNNSTSGAAKNTRSKKLLEELEELEDDDDHSEKPLSSLNNIFMQLRKVRVFLFNVIKINHILYFSFRITKHKIEGGKSSVIITNNL